MLGLMQDWPLLCHRIIEHAARFHGSQEVVTRSIEGPIHRTNYAEIRDRALKVSQRLDRDGIKLGDRVATIAWNTWRHLEVWYGIMGIGAICHTVNPRLFPEQIAWIINHAEDRVVITDTTFVPILEKIADKLPSVERYIVLTDKEHMPKTTLKNAVAYEDWIAEADGNFQWKTFDENTAAAMCYTSGTTGDPKGVLYSHRSNVLHALMANTGDSLGANASDTMLPVVPLFHANSWGIAFSAPSMGTKLVLPGAKLDGASVYELLDTEKVTHTAGVPTVWLMLLNHIAANHLKLPYLRCRGVRRLGDAALDDQGVRRHGRHRAPRLGHDRDEPDRHPRRAETSLCRTHRRCPARCPADPGLSAVRRPDEDHRRCQQGTAMGRQDLRPAESTRPGRRQGLFPRSIPASSTRKAISTPATLPPSTRTDTCGSPTGRRM